MGYYIMVYENWICEWFSVIHMESDKTKWIFSDMLIISLI